MPSMASYLDPQRAEAGGYDAAWERRFFTRMRTSNGTWKTTASGRLRPMDDLFFAALDRCGVWPRTVMDIGVSAGLTTLDWMREFERRNLDIAMIATDRHMSVYLVRLWPGFSVLLEPSGHVLQAEFMGMRFSLWCSRRDVLTGACLVKKAVSAVVVRRLRKLGISFPVRPAAAKNATGRLVGPRLLVAAALRNYRNIQFRDDDIVAENPDELRKSADVIRLANLVQRDYFSESDVTRIAANTRDRCRGDGSLVVVCRDRDGAIEGSILRLSADGRFVVQARLGPGSEAEQAFLALPAWKQAA